MTGAHGRLSYRVAGDGGRLFEYSLDKIEEIAGVEKFEPGVSPTRTYAYTPIFEQTDDLPSECAVRELGAAMCTRPDGGDADSNIPAGYTYLGQLIVHDITYLSV